MSFLLECPHCGLRDVNEFRYQGEVTRRPPPEPTLRELTDYVYETVIGPKTATIFTARNGCANI